ncbi:glycosyltransferase family 2 protein [Pseudalkalibacillus caeni]|uniref:Glycosyltransferase family 2 protein n=1 Tax=Exobacillus caeni TaxID=2574798 RepID=A0A5R9F707_9BACL|nr:glycosyltransferase family 2 protein [Pseudalkalibacillus caeni]TLS36274.1 glycosyltransferase family 2 protein [Pseudalkalibacillus caeni]
MKRNIFISILLPSFNEAENIFAIYSELTKELSKKVSRYEILFIDDGSTDRTIDKIKELALKHSEVKYIALTRNFGKEAAMFAGLKHAKGEAVIIMDADLQHPVNVIHSLIEGYREGYDQVIAQRNRTGDAVIRSKFSSLYYTVLERLIDVELKDGQGDFRLLSRRAVQAVLQISERNRFSKGLFSWIGFKKKVIQYENKSRKAGKSKWSIRKLIDYAIEGVVSFNHKPLRICLYTGVVTLFLVLIYISIMFIQILAHGISVPGYFTTISSVLFLGGVQLVSLGVIGEYIGRIYVEAKQRPLYLIENKCWRGFHQC